MNENSRAQSSFADKAELLVDARELVGTIYLPRNKLLIDGDTPIAAESAYTVIIAREFALAEGPEVILNADYMSTDVPVPDGVGNKSNKSARLIH